MQKQHARNLKGAWDFLGMVTDWRNFLHALVWFGRVVPSPFADETRPSQRRVQQQWQASVAFSSQLQWKHHCKGLGNRTWTWTRKRVWGISCNKHLQAQIRTCLCRKCSSICIQRHGWGAKENPYCSRVIEELLHARCRTCCVLQSKWRSNKTSTFENTKLLM